MALLILILAFLVVGALVAVVVINLNRYRLTVYYHWYAVGQRDKEYNTFWFNIEKQTPNIINAYMNGYNLK